MKKLCRFILNWLLAPKKRRTAYRSIQDWERIEGITPRREYNGKSHGKA